MKKKILSLLAAFFMLFGTSAMAQVDSTLEGDVNGDGGVDIADITAVIAIIKQNAEANPTYYWYAGWTEPTAANIATIINEEYPTDETNTSKNKAGKSATTTSGITMDYVTNPVWDPEFISSGYTKERKLYIVLPNGHAVFDSIGTNITAQNGGAFITKHSEFTNHTVWITKNTLCAADSFILREP